MDTLVCEFKLNSYFEWYGADRLGQFTELASCTYIYIYIYMYAYIIFPVFIRPFIKKLWLSVLATRSEVYIRFPYSADIPVPWFDPFLDSTTTIDGTTNTGWTWKPNNFLKGIWNPITQNLDIPCKGIWELEPVA